MERSKLLQALKAHGLHLEQGKGGETKVLTSSGDLIYGRLNLTKKDVPTRSAGNVIRGCRRKGIPFSLDESKWPKKVRKEVKIKDLFPQVKDKVKVKTEDAKFKSFSELGTETGLDPKFLGKLLKKELPPEAFWKENKKNGHVNFKVFEEWWLQKDLVPLSEHLKKIGKSYTFGQMLRAKNLIKVYEGRRGNVLVYYAEKKELEAVAKDPIRRRFGTKKIVEFDKNKYRPAPGMTLRVNKMRSSIGLRKYTPETSRDVLETKNDSIAQRPMGESHVEFLVREFYLGRLRPGNVAFVEYPDGTRKLVNGQHYLNTCIVVGETLTVTQEVYKVRNDEELLEVAFTFDNNRQTKGFAVQIAGVWAIHQPPCSKGYAGDFARGLAVYEASIDRTTGRYGGHLGKGLHDDEKAMILSEDAGHWPVIEFLESLYVRCRNDGMRKLQVIASVIWHYYIDPKAAKRFWKPILTGVGGFDEYENPRYSDPRKVLSDFLNIARLSQHGSAFVTYSEREIFQTVQKYWNLYRRGESVGKLTVSRKHVLPI